MKLREYLDRLNEMIKENPECLEYDVITAKDDEGNGYDHVHWTPSVGMLIDGGYGFCSDEEDWNEDQEFSYEEEDRTQFKPDSVCLN